MEMSEEIAKERIAKRIAQEFRLTTNRLFLNLGVGIPTMVADYVNNANVFVQAENGMLGVGPLAKSDEEDWQLINAGRQMVTMTKGCSFFDSSVSFGMIRGGHVDATVLGAFEVDEAGNIANWIIPNGKQLGVGGAMDLVSGANRVIVAIQHQDKKGKSKIKKSCALPITGFHEADLIITEYAVFAYEDGGLVLKEIAPEVTLEDIRMMTEAAYKVSATVKTMNVA
ncbi:MAG TPA: 3-oxoacid CoA-transferase subunit B [Negativicutes bacterium]|nr:3-oxoacid CoA-transferase subunit B [Negativicutes bacterium]